MPCPQYSPADSVRIVSIGDLDTEACGGTHVRRTSLVERIAITRAKRIQDGVVRLEFTVARQEGRTQRVQERPRADHSGMISELCRDIPLGTHADDTTSYNRGACVIHGYDQKFHTALAKRLLKSGHTITYCGVFRSGPAVRVMVYCTEDSPHDAMRLAGAMSDMLGGRAAGGRAFAQGGGRDAGRIGEAVAHAREALL